MLPPALLSGGYAEEAILQADGYIAALWDAEKGLFRHIWDDEKHEFLIAESWGVGNGWAISGLSRLIEHLPKDKSVDRERYIGIVKKTVEAALALKDNGLFHNFLDKPDSFIEVNFAQMLCYTVAKGIKQAWLPATLLDQMKEIRREVMKHVTPYGFVTEVCGAPTFDKQGTAPEGQAFFILKESVFAE
jgi:rhamnogalacturonyl hydrolase YesR